MKIVDCKTGEKSKRLRTSTNIFKTFKCLNVVFYIHRTQGSIVLLYLSAQFTRVFEDVDYIESKWRCNNNFPGPLMHMHRNVRVFAKYTKQLALDLKKNKHLLSLVMKIVCVSLNTNLHIVLFRSYSMLTRWKKSHREAQSYFYFVTIIISFGLS